MQIRRQKLQNRRLAEDAPQIAEFAQGEGWLDANSVTHRVYVKTL